MHSAHLENVRKLFDHWADGGYAEAMEQNYGPVARQAFDRIGLRPQSRFLDIGCGNGYAVRWACEAGALGMGIDGSPRMIERAKFAAQRVAAAKFLRGFFPSEFLKPKSFDAVFAMEAMYYMPDLDVALRSVRDLLVPGGTFACVCGYYTENTESHGWPRESGLSMVLLSQSEWHRQISNSGLIVMSQERIFNGPGAGTLLTLARRAA